MIEDDSDDSDEEDESDDSFIPLRCFNFMVQFIRKVSDFEQ
jgi:hypothetical protein